MPAAPRILGPNGQPYPVSRATDSSRRMLKSRYDASLTTDENRRHWANADSLSAKAANSADVRRKLRMRARYEVANNSYASGMVETLANDTIGTGPRFQLRIKDAKDINERVTEEFEAWADACCLAEKLRTLRESRTVDGEAFAVFIANPDLETPVKLDLHLYEADQIATPQANPIDPRSVDGIEINDAGYPTFYHLLPYHPGDLLAFGQPYGSYDRVPADMVLHWFKRRRPGQYRGVPEITPALPLYALLRRFTLATVVSAEVAAEFAAMLKSQMPPDSEDAVDGEPFETLEIERGMMTTLPAGYEMQQLKAEHPATTYEMFKREILCEIARCLQMTYNVASGNSSGYNYASGRLDHQVYHRSIGVDRYGCETGILDRILKAWLAEARIAMPGLLTGIPADRLPPHSWYWDGFTHVDPTKEASASQTRLQIGLSTLEDEWAAEGWDWRQKARQQAEEREFYDELGIPYPGAATPTAAPAPSQTPNPEDNTDGAPPSAAAAFRRLA